MMHAAVAQHQAKRFAEAESIYRQVLLRVPDFPDALHLLGLLSHQRGQNDIAVEMIAKAIRLRPEPEFYVNLSQAYRGLGRFNASAKACEEAIRLKPKLPEAYNNLGSALKELGRANEAIVAFQRAIELRPQYAQAYNNLGNALGYVGRRTEGEAALRKAISLDPSQANAYSNLSFLLNDQGCTDQAIDAARHAISLQPNLSAAYSNLGTALQNEGRFDEGNDVYRRGLQVDPNNEALHENLLVGLNYTTRATPREIFDAHLAWGDRFAPLSRRLASPRVALALNRRIRVGYVSPDFRTHSVAYFFEPLLTHHDRSRFEITAYAQVAQPDEVTARLRARCDRWRDTAGLSDLELAEVIRRDEIDILIDLAGHTLGNRLTMFAYKPAPVQATWLGYPNTTGVRAIDYRITDEIADPPGDADSLHTEKLIRLPAPFLCYQPPTQSPTVVAPPVLKNGFVTFGSFNKTSKVGPECIELWARVLKTVPRSRLMLKSRGLAQAGSRRRIVETFARHDIPAERLDLLDADYGLVDHLARYGQIDIALDTYPYHGTTTTCEALWMGVPVVSLAGPTHVSRVGMDILTCVGLSDLAAASSASYLMIAKRLASSLEGLSEIRTQARARLSESPLLDAERFAKAVESALERMLKLSLNTI